MYLWSTAEFPENQIKAKKGTQPPTPFSVFLKIRTVHPLIQYNFTIPVIACQVFFVYK